MAEKTFKLDEIQDMLENYISFISENFSEHRDCKSIITNLRSAADYIHSIRFDLAVSKKLSDENKEGK
jgi:hypothetical protein